MKRMHWILAAAACVLCLGMGFGAGALLMPRPGLQQAALPVNPMATDAGDLPLLGAGAPAETQALVAGVPSPEIKSGSSDALAAYIDAMGDSPSQDQKDLFYLALSGMENELSQYAERMQKATDLEREVRILIAEVRELAPGGDEKVAFPQEIHAACVDLQTAIVSMFREEQNYEMAISLSVKAGDALGSEEWQGVIGELDSWRDSLRDYEELAQFDLQTLYQDYSQAVQTLAGIQKQMHDDAMKILDSIR